MAGIAWALLAALWVTPARAQWVWPVSGAATPDETTTSFGPRINESRWDFHDGIDIPAPVGTPVRAVADAVVYREGPGGTDGYSSRHVVLEVNHPVDGALFVLYLHLDSIAPGVTEGAPVTQGTVLGGVGADDATYSHLHFEVRRGSPWQIASVHPLQYLPYTPSANFTAPALDRIQAGPGGRTVRLAFGAPSRLEGDLRRVELELLQGATTLLTRTLDLDDKATVREGNGDLLRWWNDLALEGYQRSDMVADERTDLQYGILARRLPDSCDSVRARVSDWGGATVSSGVLPLPSPAAFVEHLDFEDGALPPAAWEVATSSSGTGTGVAVDGAAALAGALGLHCTDLSSTESSSQTASVAWASLPAGRIGWTAEGLFRPVSLGLSAGQNAYLLYFRAGTGLSVAASARNNSGTVQAGLLVKEPDGSITSSFSTQTVAVGTARRWTLDLLRLGTRETTAVLYLDGVEAVRKAWDGRAYPPDSFRGGLGFTSVGATAELHADEAWLVDSGLAYLPSFAPGEALDLRVEREGAAGVALSWAGSCASPAAVDYAVYEGSLGEFSSHAPVACTTGGSPAVSLTPQPGDRFFLVVPQTAAGEGAFGSSTSGAPRTPASLCTDLAVTACP